MRGRGLGGCGSLLLLLVLVLLLLELGDALEADLDGGRVGRRCQLRGSGRGWLRGWGRTLSASDMGVGSSAMAAGGVEESESESRPCSGRRRRDEGKVELALALFPLASLCLCCTVCTTRMAHERHPYLYPTTPFTGRDDDDDLLAQQLLGSTQPRDASIGTARWADQSGSARPPSGAGWRQWQGRQSHRTHGVALAALALILVLFGGASTQPDVRDYVKDRVALYAGQAPLNAPRGASLSPPTTSSRNPGSPPPSLARSQRDHRDPRQPVQQHVPGAAADAREHRAQVQPPARVPDPAPHRRQAPVRGHHEPHELHHRGQGDLVCVLFLLRLLASSRADSTAPSCSRRHARAGLGPARLAPSSRHRRGSAQDPLPARLPVRPSLPRAPSLALAPRSHAR